MATKKTPAKPSKTAKKPVTRKAQAKKATAPMKNAPKQKSPRTQAKAAASRAARTMAKTVNPAIRKSAAKRVEKVETKVSVRQLTNTLIAALRGDLAAVNEGKINEDKFRRMLTSMFKAMTIARAK
jgi:hypothetical protein